MHTRRCARSSTQTHTHTNLPTLPIYKRDPTQQQTVTSPFSHYICSPSHIIDQFSLYLLPTSHPSFLPFRLSASIRKYGGRRPNAVSERTASQKRHRRHVCRRKERHML